jgi:hypothetical protein
MKKGSLVVFRGARGGEVCLDQRIEPLPPRAAPRSTIGLIVVGHVYMRQKGFIRMLRLLDHSRKMQR